MHQQNYWFMYHHFWLWFKHYDQSNSQVSYSIFWCLWLMILIFGSKVVHEMNSITAPTLLFPLSLLVRVYVFCVQFEWCLEKSIILHDNCLLLFLLYLGLKQFLVKIMGTLMSKQKCRLKKHICYNSLWILWECLGFTLKKCLGNSIFTTKYQ